MFSNISGQRKDVLTWFYDVKGWRKDILGVLLYFYVLIAGVAVTYWSLMILVGDLSEFMYQEMYVEPVAVYGKVDDSVLGLICRTFGDECVTALAVSHAENGTRQCDRMGVNTNKSVDIGIFQINSVHKKRFPISDLVDCKKNILAAKELQEEQGWGIWVAYSNQAYKQFVPLYKNYANSVGQHYSIK